MRKIIGCLTGIVKTEPFFNAFSYTNPHARMGTTNDENKDLTDFSLRLSAPARDMFFSPAETLGRRGESLVCIIFPLLTGMQPTTKFVIDTTI